MMSYGNTSIQGWYLELDNAQIVIRKALDLRINL